MPSRTIEQVLNQQFHEWEMRSRLKKKDRRLPTITISRLPGSGGRLLAERLAKNLKFDLFDRELVQRIAQSAHLSESLVNSLDEKVRPGFSEWLLTIERERYLWPHQYLQHLTKVVGVIAEHGNAIILGRGASFILDRGQSLRVSVVAPFATRVRRVAQDSQLGEREAQRCVIQVENERRAYLKRAFNADMTDPVNYDLVVNTEFLGLDHAAAAIEAVLRSTGVLE